MKLKTTTALLLCLAAGLALPSAAQAGEKNKGGKPHPRNIDHREARQEKRIDQGVKSGQLTADEAAKLKQEEAAIQQKEAAYRADGTLTKTERKDLQTDLNVTSKEIRSEKHDADTQSGVTSTTQKPAKKGTKKTTK